MMKNYLNHQQPKARIIMSNELFTIKPKGYCKDCQHRQRWQCGGRVIQYCALTQSNRTFNGLKKITVKMTCGKFEKESEDK